MEATTAAASAFELIEMPDGRWCVARPAVSPATALVAGSFVPLQASEEVHASPVGCYASRDAAELAIQRAGPARRDPLAAFAAWRRQE